MSCFIRFRMLTRRNSFSKKSDELSAKANPPIGGNMVEFLPADYKYHGETMACENKLPLLERRSWAYGTFLATV